MDDNNFYFHIESHNLIDVQTLEQEKSGYSKENQYQFHLQDDEEQFCLRNWSWRRKINRIRKTSKCYNIIK